MQDRQPKKARIIFHVDMNSFYASVEIALHPELKGAPLAIAGDPKKRHGVVVTSSYEARAHGVRTTMTVGQAKHVCPGLVVKPPEFDRYRKASAAIFDLLREYTPLVEPVSIDEGYLDITDSFGSEESPLEIARGIQNRIYHELKIPSSIGVAPNKFLAKMASDMEKPLGLTVLRKRDLPTKLWPFDIGQMHGIGDKTKEKLNRIGVTTIRDLAHADDVILKKTMGVNGEKMKQRANGEDSRPVDPDAVSEFKSIGTSTTLPTDATDSGTVADVLRRLADSVEKRMEKKVSVAFNIQIMIRYNDRKNVTRSRQLNNPVNSAEEIFDAAYILWEQHWNGQPIRLLGITAQALIEKDDAYKQLDLFSYEQDAKKADRDQSLSQTVSHIRNKYGDEAVQYGKNQQSEKP